MFHLSNEPKQNKQGRRFIADVAVMNRARTLVPRFHKMRSLHLFRLRLKRKVIVLLSLLGLLTIMHFLLPGHPGMVRWYSNYIFRPFQTARNFLFGHIGFSFGDLLYIVGGIGLIMMLIRWIYFLVKFRSHAHYLGTSALSFINVLAVLYIIFFFGWGGNYYKPGLSGFWNLSTKVDNEKAVLISYDQYLISQLNRLAPSYRPESFRSVNKNARQYYRDLTDSRTRMHGLSAKPSIFGYFMQYLGIQGYYNPFTGEAQVNRFLPPFMLPFVVCHEMAHQSGIAAEGDANLLSFALCTRTNNPSFAYSGYFNIWLYTHSRVKMMDSVQANLMYADLNPVSRQQLDTLRQIRDRYQGSMSNISAQVYDSYLRWHDQKEGIDSYFDVAMTAWAYETQKRNNMELLRIP